MPLRHDTVPAGHSLRRHLLTVCWLSCCLLAFLVAEVEGQTVTPGFGSLTGQWAQGTNTVTLTAGTNISITGAAQAIGGNVAFTVATSGVPAGSGVANTIALWSAANTLTNLAAMTNGQVVIGSTGVAPVLGTLTGTANQVVVTNGAGSITFSAPQNLHTAATPQFGGLTITGFSGAVSAAAGVLSAGTLAVTNGGTGQTSFTDGQLLIGNTVGNTLTKATLTAGTGVTITNGNGTITPALNQAVTPTWTGPHIFSGGGASQAPIRVSASAAPTVVVDGDRWNDSTRKAPMFGVVGLPQSIFGVLYTQTVDTNVANNLAETSIVGAGVGSAVLPASWFVAGRSMEVKAAGIISSAAVPGTIELKVNLNAVTILDTGAQAFTGSLSNRVWKLEGLATCRSTGASGTVNAQGLFTYATAALGGLNAEDMPNIGTSTVDTTAIQTPDVLVQWGTADASNSITCTYLTVKAVN